MFILVRLQDIIFVWIVRLTSQQTTISDLIQIRPNELHKPTAEALEDNINRKYANRVRKIALGSRKSAKMWIGSSKCRTLHLSMGRTASFRGPDRPR